MSESVLLVHGKPGAGKSSCCRCAVENASLWVQDTPVRHLSVGQHFRSIARGEIPSQYSSEIKKIANEVLALALPSHLLVQGVVEEYVSNADQPGVTLIDGYPKEPELLPLLHKAVAEGKFTLLGCVSVVVSDEEAIKRQLTRTSVDGHPACDYETVLRRVAAHNAQTEPVAASLAQTYGHEIVSGEWTFPVVAEDFMCALGRRMLSHVELEGQTTGSQF